MTEPDFTHTPLSWVGAFLDWLLGPCTTTTIEGPAKTRTLTIESETIDPWPRAIVLCRRLVFRTQYQRWWVPTVRRTLYEVSIRAPAMLIDRYGAQAFAPATYPLLCNRLLQWTTYPHLCAAEAYIDALLTRLGGSKTNQRSILL